MGYLVKIKGLNMGDWILKNKGLNYGFNYIGFSFISNDTLPSWYICSSFNHKTMSIENDIQDGLVLRTRVVWDKELFPELLKIMDEYEVIETSVVDKKVKSKKEMIREKWLDKVSCPHCGLKNIHKKDKRQRINFQVQRYQCLDCKSIFQERIEEGDISTID